MKKQTLQLLGIATILSLSISYNSFATNKALLIGVSNYQDPIYRLEGPKYDVSVLKKTLQQNWGFKSENIKTLLDSEATRDNILKALIRLKDNSQANDQVFIYFSGHGTSEHDKSSDVPLPYSNSGAQVPYEFRRDMSNKQMIENLIIGKRDLRPILSALDKTNAQVFIAFDSCYSGTANRGISNSLPSRTLSTPIFDINDFDDEVETEDFNYGTKAIEPYPYKNIVYFSAASPRETAKDIPTSNLAINSTIDNKAHGAFTDALLRALTGKLNTDQNGDGQTNYSELLVAVKDFMKTRDYAHEPQISPALTEDYGSLSLRNVMGRQDALPDVQVAKSSLLGVYVDPAASRLISVLKQQPLVKVSTQPADLNLEKKGNDYLFSNKAGDLITTLHSPDVLTIVGRVQQEGWKKYFKQQLQQYASINIEMAIKEGITGATAVQGELVAFSLRSEKLIYLLLLDADSSGTVSVLYPYKANELNPIPAHQVKYIPSENKKDWIKVQAPFGIDHLIAIGFAEQPSFLKEFIGKDVLLLQSELYKKLMGHIQTARFGYSELDLVTIPTKKNK